MNILFNSSKFFVAVDASIVSPHDRTRFCHFETVALTASQTMFGEDCFQNHDTVVQAKREKTGLFPSVILNVYLF
jgi:hypothetical protein